MPKVNVYLPDDLYRKVKEAGVPVSAVTQAALERHLADLRREEAMEKLMDRLEVTLWGPEEKEYGATFVGRWLVAPDPDETRGGDDAGAYWGVALTKRRQIAVYVAHVNDGWSPSLDTYANIEEAREAGVPAEVLNPAAEAVGEPVELDI